MWRADNPCYSPLAFLHSTFDFNPRHPQIYQSSILRADGQTFPKAPKAPSLVFVAIEQVGIWESQHSVVTMSQVCLQSRLWEIMDCSGTARCQGGTRYEGESRRESNTQYTQIFMSQSAMRPVWLHWMFYSAAKTCLLPTSRGRGKYLTFRWLVSPGMIFLPNAVGSQNGCMGRERT